MAKRAIVLAIVAGLIFPALAAARIVVNHSMFGVSVGETAAQARQHLGAAPKVSHMGIQTVWVYAGRKLVITFLPKSTHIEYLFTENPSQRTASGLGVGSTEAAIKHALPAAKCTTQPGGPECDLIAHHGSVYDVTDFAFFSSKRVAAVLIGAIPKSLLGSAAAHGGLVPALERAMR